MTEGNPSEYMELNTTALSKWPREGCVQNNKINGRLILMTTKKINRKEK